MTKAQELHRKAMEYADQAELLRMRGMAKEAREALESAYRCEKKAATAIAKRGNFEPSRSVLLRSAASLALECGHHREAEKLVALGLSGDPPHEIASEMRDLLEQINFERHLALRGVTLAPNELQFSLTGESIGFGFARSDTFSDRIKDLDMLVFRTGERLLEKPYRDRGRREIQLKDRLETYVSMPRAASFAVTLRLGASAQTEILGASFSEKVIDELFDGMDLINEKKSDELISRIPDEGYYRNFLGLVKRIAPDGVAVKTVGLTVTRVSGVRTVALKSSKDESDETTALGARQAVAVLEEPERLVTLKGRLLFADEISERRSKISIVDDEGKEWKIKVPIGLMSDIVRPLWEHEVEVKAKREGKIYVLEDIRAAR